MSSNRSACLSILASDWLTGISPWLCRYNHDFTMVESDCKLACQCLKVVVSWLVSGCKLACQWLKVVVSWLVSG